MIHPDWRKLLRYSWSVRFIALAALLSGAEVALPYIQPITFLPQGTFAALAGVTTIAAFAARLLAQRQFRKVSDGDE